MNEADERKVNQEINDDGVVYFDANDNAQAKAGGSEGNAFSNHNPKVNFGKKPKKKGKKKWIIGGIILLIIILGAVGSCGGSDYESETYDWPADSELAKMLPTPEGEITYIYVDDDEGYLNADVTTSGASACKAYIDACKEKGFTVDKNTSQSGEDYDYTAKNEDDWVLQVYNYDKDMNITLMSSAYAASLEDDSDYDEEESESDDVSSDFKETMDDYEAFMDDYIEFMEKYENSSDTASMLSDYTDMMTQYQEFADKIDNIDEDSLSDSDYEYYIEVTTRVNEKLAKAAL